MTETALRVFDTHCHLDDEKFAPDREEAYQRMLAAGVSRCVCVGSDLPSSRRCLDFAASHEGVYAAAGVHPHEAQAAPADYLLQLRDLLREEKAVALGKSGWIIFTISLPGMCRSGCCRSSWIWRLRWINR